MTTVNDNEAITPKSAGVTDQIRETAEAAIETVRDKAADTYAVASETAAAARERAARELDDNPIAFLVGGLALGALAGSLLPRTQRETELLGPAGRRISGTASDAVKAAKAAGQDKLDELGISTSAAKEQIDKVFKSVGEAAKEASAAATKTVKGTGAAASAAIDPDA